MNTKNIIFLAKILTLVFSPFYLPLVSLLALFLFTHLGALPFTYKAVTVLAVYVFSVALPRWLIGVYRRYQGWTLFELGHREKRAIPYVISILCYGTLYYLMLHFSTNRYILGIVVAALAVQVACSVVNPWWKISTHIAALGAVTGALVAFSLIMGFNPVWWIALLVLLAGVMGTSRMVLRQHSLAQVVGGWLLGLVAGLVAIFAA